MIKIYIVNEEGKSFENTRAVVFFRILKWPTLVVKCCKTKESCRRHLQLVGLIIIVWPCQERGKANRFLQQVGLLVV